MPPKKKITQPKKDVEHKEDKKDTDSDEEPKENNKEKEDTVIKLSHRDHQRIRSDMYGASKTHTKNKSMIYNEETKKIEQIELIYPIGVFKIFDEVITNAIDQYTKYPTLIKTIKVNFDTKTGEIIVYNDGKGIPIEEKTFIDSKTKIAEKRYIPEWCFCSPMTGSNFNDPTKTVAGVNGIGVKLTSSLSKNLTVETCDSKKIFTQTNRMLDDVDLPVIKEPKSEKYKKEYTRVIFNPDYDLFKFHDFKIMHKLILTRTIQSAVHTGINVYYNDELLDINFEKYCNMICDNCVKIDTKYVMPQTRNRYCKFKNNESFDLYLGVQELKGGITHSLINGIIIDGGTHFTSIKANIVNVFKENLKTDTKDMDTKDVAKYLTILAKINILQPSFGSNAKNVLTNPSVVDFDNFKLDSEAILKFKSQLKGLLNISDIDDTLSKMTINRNPILDKYHKARKSGTKDSNLCTLIIAEGDSAMGIGQIALGATKLKKLGITNEFYGLFPLRGVITNGRKKSKIIEDKNDEDENGDHEKEEKYVPTKALLENKEIKALIEILGLNFKCTYESDEDIKTLNYGALLSLTDQDLDGGHINGLIFTFFITYFPILVKKGFIRRFDTPLIRATKGQLSIPFYTDSEFNEFSAKYPLKGFKITYCKGLGSHDPKEVVTMFSDLPNKLCKFTTNKETQNIMNIFYGVNPDTRKVALKHTPINPDENKNTEEYKGQFINGMRIINTWFTYQVASFQRDNLLRKLLNLIDGLVISRRKVLYCARKIARSDFVKISKISASAIDICAYKHGNASLDETIIKMAQNGSDSNNLPLLLTKGNFGTRAGGYSNNAAARYIFTKLNARLVDLLFRKEDDYLLEYEEDEGELHEPKNYIPIIPYALCESHILPATGWKIEIHARNIDDIFTNVRNLINDKPMIPLRMCYKDFKGSIVDYNKKQYFVGNYTVSGNTIHITELPPRIYPNNYMGAPAAESGKVKKTKELKTGKKKPAIKVRKEAILKKYASDLKDYSSTVIDGKHIDIKLNFKPNALDRIIDSTTCKSDKWDKYVEAFNLKKAITHAINMVDEDGNVVEFKSYEDVLKMWFVKRKALYILRVQMERIVIKYKIIILEEQIRFSINDEKMGITGKKKLDEFNTILAKHDFKMYNTHIIDNPERMSFDDFIKTITTVKVSYDYLLNLNSKQRSLESNEKRKKEIDVLKERLELIKNDGKRFDGATLWLYELDELEQVIKDNMYVGWNADQEKIEEVSKEDYIASLGKTKPKKVYAAAGRGPIENDDE